jgi:hypothetical protein
MVVQAVGDVHRGGPIETNGAGAGDLETGIVFGDHRIVGDGGGEFASVADAARHDGVGIHGAPGIGVRSRCIDRCLPVSGERIKDVLRLQRGV